MKRVLTDEEKQLWKALAKTTKPLRRGSVVKADEDNVAAPEKKKPASKVTTKSPLPGIRAPAVPQPISQGVYANIDRNTAERFRKGEMKIDATLDLHGMTRHSAHGALIAFIASQQAQGSRCVLVITGKGLRQPGDHPERGILREMLPQWLDTFELRPLVLTFDTARPKHGGAGAYYVLLRRKR